MHTHREPFLQPGSERKRSGSASAGEGLGCASLGPAESWSPALQAVTRLVLANRFPMLLWWGPAYTQLYNDAYRPILATKHPEAQGQPARECWADIWRGDRTADRNSDARGLGHLGGGPPARNQPGRVRRGNPFHRRLQSRTRSSGAERDRRVLATVHEISDTLPPNDASKPFAIWLARRSPTQRRKPVLLPVEPWRATPRTSRSHCSTCPIPAGSGPAWPVRRA